MKKCPSCKGTRKILRDRPPSEPGGSIVKVNCPRCNGKGRIKS